MGQRADLAATIRGPRRGEVWSIQVTSTGKAYNLRKLAFENVLWDNEDKRRGDMILRLEAWDGDVYFQLDSQGGSVTLDGTAVQASTTVDAAAFANTYAPRVPNGGFRDFQFDRGKDLYLHVRTLSGVTARLDVFLSSDLPASAEKATYGA